MECFSGSCVQVLVGCFKHGKVHHRQFEQSSQNKNNENFLRNAMGYFFSLLYTVYDFKQKEHIGGRSYRGTKTIYIFGCYFSANTILIVSQKFDLALTGT